MRSLNSYGATKPVAGKSNYWTRSSHNNLATWDTSSSILKRCSVGKSMHFSRPDGRTTAGYFASAGEQKPSVVVIQEWWGLNDHIRAIADRLAAAGFNALAPDLYVGRVAKDADEASHMMTGLDFPDATHQDIRGAVDYVGAVGSPVGVVGFCMGGALTIAAAVHVPAVAAAVCFYGIPPADFAAPDRIQIPFQGHFANADDWCTPTLVDELELAMKGKNPAPEIHRYDAQHAFFNNTRAEVYDATVATLAWERTTTFFAKHLRYSP
jgi:carboxymethylenebutenolidase